jgi:RNA polymerase sigma factor (sigma-70 family)
MPVAAVSGFPAPFSGKLSRGGSRRELMSLGERFASVLGAARTGQRWAWEAIYRELSPTVLGYLRAQGASEPGDLTGEVFLQVVRDLPDFEGGESQFRAWTFAIAHNRLVDQRRSLKRRPVEELRPVEQIDHTQTGGSAEDEALSRIEEQRVRQTLARLTEDQRNVILLRVLGDLTVEQVAAALGRTPGAVRALERRGLATLRRQFSNLVAAK